MKKGQRNIFAALFSYFKLLFVSEEFSATVYNFGVFTNCFVYQV